METAPLRASVRGGAGGLSGAVQLIKHCSLQEARLIEKCHIIAGASPMRPVPDAIEIEKITHRDPEERRGAVYLFEESERSRSEEKEKEKLFR